MEKNKSNRKNNNKDESSNLFKIGKIIKIFGIKGEVLVIDYNKDYSTFINFNHFFIGKVNFKNELIKYEVENFRGNFNKIILKLKNINSRNDAENLKDEFLFIERENLALNSDEYFVEDIINSECFFKNIKIGTVINIVNYGTCDIFEMELSEKDDNGKKKIVNLPHTKEVVENFIFEKKAIYLKEEYLYYL